MLGGPNEVLGVPFRGHAILTAVSPENKIHKTHKTYIYHYITYYNIIHKVLKHFDYEYLFSDLSGLYHLCDLIPAYQLFRLLYNGQLILIYFLSYFTYS